MPIEYTIDADRQRVVCEATGNVTAEDCMALDREMRADPGNRPEFDTLYDFSAVTGTTLSAEDIRKIARQESYHTTDSHRAVVARSPLSYGYSRMFELCKMGRAGTWRIFNERGEAERWLEEDRPARTETP